MQEKAKDLKLTEDADLYNCTKQLMLRLAPFG